MAEIIFVLGGARSGKSSHAVKLAEGYGKRVVFLATGVPCDEEMKARSESHREQRPKSWQTIEEPLNVVTVLKKLDDSVEVALLDCLTLWVSNLLLHFQKQGISDKQAEEKIIDYVSQMIQVAKSIKSKLLVVSNEVGMGIVPETALGRLYRDILGRSNQIVAAAADKMFLLVAGQPIAVK